MSKVVLTLDVDWVPDFVIDDIANRLMKAGACATWFITHDSPAVQSLLTEPSFECGIHPNFYPGSSQGETTEEVFDYCLSIAPQAVTMRTHGLLQSSRIYNYACEKTPIKIDVSTLMFGAPSCDPGWHIAPVGKLLKVPFQWEDDIEMNKERPDWTAGIMKEADPFILNFHPIHIYLNSADMTAYNDVKARASDLQNVSKSIMDESVQQGNGAGTLFDQILENLKQAQDSSTIKRVFHECI